MANENKRGGKTSPTSQVPAGRQRRTSPIAGKQAGENFSRFKQPSSGRQRQSQAPRPSNADFNPAPNKEAAWGNPRQKPDGQRTAIEGGRTEGFRPSGPSRGRPFNDSRYRGKAVKGDLFGRQQETRVSPASLRFGPESRPFQAAPTVPQRPNRQQPGDAVGTDARTPVSAAPPPVDYAEETVSAILLTGRNPIREAIKSGRDLEKLMISKGELSGSAREIVSLAKKAGVMIQSVERSRLDQLAKNHQGMIAFASAYAYASVEDILQTAKDANEEPFIILLDQVTDPHNLGAIIRTASCAGAHGVIVPMHRAAGLTPAAVKASAGAVEHIKVARVTNLNQAIKSLQSQGVWFYAAEPDGEDYRKVSLSGPCALVIGSEGEGVSPLTASLCDKTVSIPMSGPISSLNASVAAGVLMFAVRGARNPA